MRPRRAVRAALLGAGAWGRVLAAAAAGSSRIEFVACWARTRERLAEFSRQTQVPLRGSLAELLEDRDIEAVVLALPNEQHLHFAAAAARAGKHVYIEKPIANTLDDALRIAALEPAHGVRIAVGHCARLLAGNRLMRAAIDRGELGNVTLLEASFSHDRGLRLTPSDWRWYQASAPGGPLSQIGIHQFDTLAYLGGEIAAVSAAAARHSPVGAEVEDQWVVTVRFADGKLGCVISSWTSPGCYSVKVTGDAALMYYEIDQSRWSTPERAHEHAVLQRRRRGAGLAEAQSLAVPPGNMVREELELFADAIVERKPCELSAANGCRVLAAVYASLASSRKGGAFVPLAQFLPAGPA